MDSPQWSIILVKKRPFADGVARIITSVWPVSIRLLIAHVMREKF